jgi:hypothetical protein
MKLVMDNHDDLSDLITGHCQGSLSLADEGRLLAAIQSSPEVAEEVARQIVLHRE